MENRRTRFKNIEIQRVIDNLNNSDKFSLQFPDKNLEKIRRFNRGVVKICDGVLIQGFNEYHLYTCRKEFLEKDRWPERYRSSKLSSEYKKEIIKDFSEIIGEIPTRSLFQKHEVDLIYDILISDNPLNFERLKIIFQPWGVVRPY